MRGRTLNDAFIILDEAQNTTPEQMKMFLTRLGFGSKIVVTGDVTQVDLPGGTRAGLQVVREILDDVDDVHFAQLTSADVVRHRLVGDIVDAYERWDAGRTRAGEAPAGAGRADRRAGHRGSAATRRARRRPGGPADVSIEVANESGVEVDDRRRARLSPGTCSTRCGSTRSPSCRSCWSTSPTMTELHVQWMDEPGPTDVMTFPMDELARSTAAPDDAPTASRRCSATSCSARRSAETQAGAAGHSLDDELHLLTVHGVLHLLGYDHAEPDEEREMFRLQNAARSWRARRRWPRGAGRSDRPCRHRAAEPPTLERRRRRREGLVRPLAGMIVLLLVVAALLVPIAGCSPPPTRRSPGLGPASRSWPRGPPRRRTLARSPPTAPRYTNLLLLLRLVCELDRDGAGRTGRVRARSSTTAWLGALVTAARRWSWSATSSSASARARSVASTPTRSAWLSRGARGALARPGARARSPAADPDRQRGHARAAASGRARSPPRSSCASWSTWPSSAAWSSDDEREMIHSVFELGDTIVREVMVPRTEMVWIERDKSRPAGADAGAAQRASPASR